MASKNNSTCMICGKEYSACNTCFEQKQLKPWKAVVDTVDHYMIYLALHEYSLSANKAQAKKALEKCNLDGLDSFNPEIKNVINNIINEPKRTKQVEKQPIVLSQADCNTKEVAEDDTGTDNE